MIVCRPDDLPAEGGAYVIPDIVYLAVSLTPPEEVSTVM